MEKERPVDKLFPEKRIFKEIGLCTTCGKPIKENEFRDKLSEKEFGISGMCQVCQDEVFGG